MTLEKISPSRWVLRVENDEFEVDQSTVEKMLEQIANEPGTRYLLEDALGYVEGC